MKPRFIPVEFLFVISFICILFIVSCDNEKSNNRVSDNEKISIEEEQVKSSIAAKEARELMQVIENEPGTRSSGSAYPDYFGGIYLDDNFDLVLVIVDDNPEKYRSMAETKVKNVKLNLQKGEFSMNELKEIQGKLDDFFHNSAPKSIMDNLISASLKIKLNRIVIEFMDISPTKIDEFKKAFMDSPAIIYTQGIERLTDVASIKPGSEIKGPGIIKGSVGYRAMNSANQVGIVCSGHVFTIVNQSANVNGVNVGNVANTKNSGNIDAAFVRITNSNYQPSNIVDVTEQELISETAPFEGEKATLRGINGTYSNGKVIDVSIGAPGPGGTYLSDQIRIGPAPTTNGDSGGIAYTGFFILGVIKGVAGGNTYVSKAHNINSTFGLTTY